MNRRCLLVYYENEVVNKKQYFAKLKKDGLLLFLTKVEQCVHCLEYDT